MGEGKRLRSASFVRRPSATELCSVAGPSRQGIGETHEVAPWMGEARSAQPTKRSFLRAERLAKGEASVYEAPASCADRATPSYARRLDWQGWRLAKPRSCARDGLHKQFEVKLPNRHSRQSVASRAERLAKGEASVYEAPASCAARATPSYARRLDWQGWRLAKSTMSRQGRHAPG